MINDKTLLELQRFSAKVRAYYQIHGRHDLPWRQPEADGQFDAYNIMVSELMLQQTQVARVIPKYETFLSQFPGFPELAAAPLGEVLRAWSGLGYNRRAKFLHETARRVMQEHGGGLPASASELVKLPGIGTNTAGAILAYAYNQPVVFVETNIRTVYIHHFFHDQTAVTDKTILELVAATLDRQQPRQWYWALMDYGAHLKRTMENPNQRSKHYTKQAKFAGSKRQLRGQVIRLLGNRPHSMAQLEGLVPDPRLPAVLDELLAERLIQRRGTAYRL